jgi:hypothetical protein
MTPTEINEAIARSLGWTEWLVELGDGKIIKTGMCDESGDWQQHAPNYYANLNNCAEFEASLTTLSGKNAYINKLQDILDSIAEDKLRDIIVVDFDFCTATAAQRCEAYLRLKRLWK